MYQAEQPGYADAPQAPTPRMGPLRYLLAHWRGELPLWQSFWVNCVALDGLLYFLWIETWNLSYPDDAYIAIVRATVSISVLTYLLWPWQLVGCWRASLKHVQLPDGADWGKWARGYLVVAAMNLLVLPTGQSGFPTEDLRIAITGDENANYTVTFAADNEGVIVEGDFGWGLTDRVRTVLDAHPDVQKVLLESGGGWVEEGQDLHRLIHDRGLNTYVSGECSSACVTAFLGGRERVLWRGGEMGFHASSGGDEADIAHDKQFDLDAGVDPAFVERSYQTPNDSMWYPSYEELLNANVVTEVKTLKSER